MDRRGTVLKGKYELLDLVGSGGMAVVWRGVARGTENFRKEVAVKRILEKYRTSGEAIEMFVEEARVGAALQHPNIVQVFDFDVDEQGHHFMVSEYVRGLHLGDYVKAFASFPDGAPWHTIAAIAVETLRALDAAHTREDEKGRPAPILHRDVTPSNILIDSRGVVKLADFGMARALDRERTTQPDIIKGKLSYLAPELVLGQDPSPRSDLFALGVVMWEALTGKRLFDAGTDVEVVEAVRDARVPLLTAQRPGLPLGLATVVHRALEREPELRPASARDMLQAITGELRVLPSTTDSTSLSACIRQAQEALGRR